MAKAITSALLFAPAGTRAMGLQVTPVKKKTTHKKTAARRPPGRTRTCVTTSGVPIRLARPVFHNHSVPELDFQSGRSVVAHFLAADSGWFGGNRFPGSTGRMDEGRPRPWTARRHLEATRLQGPWSLPVAWALGSK